MQACLLSSPKRVTHFLPSSWSTESSQNSRARIWMHCQDWSTLARGDCTLRTTRPLPRQVGFLPAIRIFRTFRSDVSWGATSGVDSFHAADGNCWLLITPRSNCVCSRTCQEIRPLLKHSVPAVTFIGKLLH